MNIFTQKHISFLSLVSKNYWIDNSNKSNYLKLNTWGLLEIMSYIDEIEDNDVFSVLPLISTTHKMADPYLVLSEPFLVTNQSKPELITDFLNEQFFNCDFDISDDAKGSLYIKYKKVYIKEKQNV